MVVSQSVDREGDERARGRSADWTGRNERSGAGPHGAEQQRHRQGRKGDHAEDAHLCQQLDEDVVRVRRRARGHRGETVVEQLRGDRAQARSEDRVSGPGLERRPPDDQA